MDTASIIVLTSLVASLIGISIGAWTQQSQIKWLTTRYRKVTNDYYDLMDKAFPYPNQLKPTKFSAFVQNHKK
tara:strand:- start:76 stop:294 length:219 start_codon:yes stop_codon:yes gene_type:complete